MPLTAFDHVNVRTARLGEMIAFYGDILGLHPGKRPDFGFPGAWLYLGDQALIHLVGVEGPLDAGDNLTLEHFSFSASNFKEFESKLKARGIDYRLGIIEDIQIVQVNIYDPDGNHIHIDFDSREMEG